MSNPELFLKASFLSAGQVIPSKRRILGKKRWLAQLEGWEPDPTKLEIVLKNKVLQWDSGGRLRVINVKGKTFVR